MGHLEQLRAPVGRTDFSPESVQQGHDSLAALTGGETLIKTKKKTGNYSEVDWFGEVKLRRYEGQ